MTSRMRGGLAALLLLVVFGAGVGVGIGLDRRLGHHRFGHGPFGGPPRMFAELKEALELDTSQAEMVEKILTEERASTHTKFVAFRKEFDASLSRGRDRIRAVLRPEQVEKFERWIEEHPRPPPPPDLPHPPDVPPPPPPIPPG